MYIKKISTFLQWNAFCFVTFLVMFSFQCFYGTKKIRRKIIQHLSYYTADFCLLCYFNFSGVLLNISYHIEIFSQNTTFKGTPCTKMFLSIKYHKCRRVRCTLQLLCGSRGEGRNWYMHNPHIKVYFFKEKNGEGEWTYLKRGGNER